METKVLPNNIVIGEVKRMLDVAERVVLPVKGNSMLPFIIGDRESVELVKPKELLKVGDVVLAWVDGNRYVVHRIISAEGNRLTLMGDGNIAGTEHCTAKDVVARAEYVIDAKGRRHDLYADWRCYASRLWRTLLPVRRWILAIYRRTWLKIIS